MRAVRPRAGVRGPTARTSPALSRFASACDTVGFDSPLVRARSARDAGPFCRSASSRARSLIARNKRGVPRGADASGIDIEIVRKLALLAVAVPSIAHDRDFVLGIDFGGTKIAVASADLAGRPIESDLLATNAPDGARQAVDRALAH